jgi:uncharacterized protein YbgA (DUF1722 family)/uncharacterized protein YbbK (DUF523 family)
MKEKVKIGISSCLLGNNVRWNGGHKLDRFLANTLGACVDFIPVCPEAECGLGIPRETLRLVGDPANPRLINTKSKIDRTDQMQTWARKRLKALEREALCGFIFKCDSPSSGMTRVKVYSEKGMPVKKGVGIFARMFMEHFPRLPVEDDGRLHNPGIRENFIEQIFALKRWREILKGRKSLGKLVDFHTRHKLQMLSHSQKIYRQMGRLVATGKQMPMGELYCRYESLFMEALKLRTTVKKNINVLTHMLGYFKKKISGDEKQEVLEIIQRYGNGNIPLIVPITLFNHFVRKYDTAYLKQRVYLNPHPMELGLRSYLM